jgi:hypothetical protein
MNMANDAGRRWVLGKLPSSEYFARVYEEERAKAREDVRKELLRRSAQGSRRRQAVAGN